MDQIKEAFQKVKEDMLFLHKEISNIRQEIEEIKRTLDRQTNQQTDRQISPTHQEKAYFYYPEEAVKTQNLGISTGNKGVQTDKQTDRQTDRQTPEYQKNTKNDPISHLQEVSRLLASLDEVKKEIRTKFKKLTNQEMAVFATIYQLEEKGLIVDYALLAEKLSLSESAIRDYILRITKKGVPIQKTKENNKKVILSITSEIKKIANLATIQELRKI